MMESFAMQLHETLLRVAGWAPDDVVAEARAQLAAGNIAATTRTLVFAGRRAVLPLTDDDMDLLEDLLVNDDVDAQMLDRLAVGANEGLLLWRFAARLSGGDAPTDEVTDEALVSGIEHDVWVRGIWRAWRSPIDDTPYPPPCLVYVVEVDDALAEPTAVVELAGRLQRRLISAGEAVPRVEVVSMHVDPPVYQQTARAFGQLVWSRTSSPTIAIARVFDKVDPVHGPSFDLDHPRMADEAERRRTIDYLRAGTELLVSLGMVEDVIDPRRGIIVPMSFRTDGSWIWTDSTAYYLEQYHLAPDAELLRHVQGVDGPPARPDSVALQHAMSTLTAPEIAEQAVWSL